MTDLTALGRAFAARLAVTVLFPGPMPPTRGASATIRLGILREQERVVVMSNRAIEVQTGAAARFTLDPAAYEVVSSPAGVEIIGVGRVETPLRLLPTAGGRLHVAIRPYPGVLEGGRTPPGRATAL